MNPAVWGSALFTGKFQIQVSFQLQARLCMLLHSHLLNFFHQQPEKKRTDNLIIRESFKKKISGQPDLNRRPQVPQTCTLNPCAMARNTVYPSCFKRKMQPVGTKNSYLLDYHESLSYSFTDEHARGTSAEH